MCNKRGSLKMWELRSTHSCMRESSNTHLHSTGMWVETEEEAESWWVCRESSRNSHRTVSVMLNPQGEVVRVNLT